ncbi:hypothetical protein AGMMS49960_06820 [Betaproteobacteria bacterium]|nr:hypothetical protein AGMMS49543_21510 [Betaproteobacteria bacterium]GHT99970.1 hypothetical protein AGMMS49960_06820 [Betaproteobacteria bacterium]GHU22884.1 hypothetical protein AGMMS50243_23310 [Betaproteobacteria bacterium]
MSDDIDRANEQAERIASVELAWRAPAGPTATGFCLNCGEPVAPGLRWCDVECRDDWQWIDAQLRKMRL